MECFAENLDFFGNDVKKSIAPNATSCQMECQQTEECKFWSFNTGEGKNCWLKSNNQHKEHKFNRISGPKYCGESTKLPQACIDRKKKFPTILKVNL